MLNNLPFIASILPIYVWIFEYFQSYSQKIGLKLRGTFLTEAMACVKSGVDAGQEVVRDNITYKLTDHDKETTEEAAVQACFFVSDCIPGGNIGSETEIRLPRTPRQIAQKKQQQRQQQEEEEDEEEEEEPQQQQQQQPWRVDNYIEETGV